MHIIEQWTTDSTRDFWRPVTKLCEASFLHLWAYFCPNKQSEKNLREFWLCAEELCFKVILTLSVVYFSSFCHCYKDNRMTSNTVNGSISLNVNEKMVTE